MLLLLLSHAELWVFCWTQTICYDRLMCVWACFYAVAHMSLYVCECVCPNSALSSQALHCVNGVPWCQRSRLSCPACFHGGRRSPRREWLWPVEVKLLPLSSADDKFIYLAESGLLAKTKRLVRRCVLSCFLSCTSLCCGSLVNAQLKGRSCSQDGPPARNDTAWLPKTAALLFQCLSYSSSTLKYSLVIVITSN